MKLRWKDTYITEYVTTVTWSGSASQASRSLEFEIASNPYDSSFKGLKIALADLIYFYDGGKCLFVGVITGMERTGEIGTVRYSAKDFMHYLLRSNGNYVFKNTKAENITKKICNDMQIRTGTLAKTSTNIKKLIVQNDSYYNIIIRAYTRASATYGDKYLPVMQGMKLAVIPRGLSSGITLTQSADITESSYEQNTNDMVNKVIMVSDKWKKIGTITDNSSIKKYGLYQSVYQKEDGVNAKKGAKKLLKGVSKSAKVDAIGNTACVSGYSIKIKDAATGLTGKFYIENDSHTFENGVHTMSLDLAFSNVMEDVSS